MAKDPFLLVSLEESESKNLAQVISNDTARKILDFLSKKDGAATESDISKQLKIALSTVHYNLQALVKANLVVAEEFHYSEKGKEVLHYSLANKLIIIAPKKSSAESFKDKLKSLLPIGIISVATAGVIALYQRFSSAAFSSKGVAEPMMFTAVQDEAAGIMLKESSAPVDARMAVESVAAAPTAPPILTPDFLALWFLAGSLFTLLVLVIWYYFSSKKNKNS
jgi:predicted transcriptional regulator